MNPWLLIFYFLSACRPCTDDELIQHYCGADFVAKGYIEKVVDETKLEYTTIHFRASKVYQQTRQVFKQLSKNHSHKDHLQYSGTEIFTQIESNLLSDDDGENVNDIIPTFYENLYSKDNNNKEYVGGHSDYIGKLKVPLHCGAQTGPGQFLVMGNVRLDQPMLRCAPWFQDWVKLAKKSQNDAPCILDV